MEKYAVGPNHQEQKRLLSSAAAYVQGQVPRATLSSIIKNFTEASESGVNVLAFQDFGDYYTYTKLSPLGCAAYGFMYGDVLDSLSTQNLPTILVNNPEEIIQSDWSSFADPHEVIGHTLGASFYAPMASQQGAQDAEIHAALSLGLTR